MTEAIVSVREPNNPTAHIDNEEVPNASSPSGVAMRQKIKAPDIESRLDDILAALAGLEDVTVTAANLDIRDLLFATDKIDATGSSVGLAAASIASLRGIDISTVNSTTTPLAAGATFTGTAEDISAYAQLTVVLYGTPSTAKATMFFEFSPDGTNWDVSVPVFVTDPTLFIPIPLVNVGKFFRVRYLNDGGVAALAIFPGTGTAGTPTLQTAFRLSTILHKTATKEITRSLAQPITPHQPATVVRAVPMGQQPDGDYVNTPAGGPLPGNASSTPLANGATFTGTFQPTIGQVSIAVLVKTDQISAVNGIKVDFSDDGVTTVRTESRDFDAAEVAAGSFFFSLPIQATYSRVRYINGPVTQGTFYLSTVVSPVALDVPRSTMESVISAVNLAVMVRSVLNAKSAAGVYGNIERGTSGGLDIGIVQHEVSTPLRPGNGWGVTKITATTTSAILFTAPTGCVSVDVFNSDNNISLRINRDASSVDGGQYRTVLAGNSVVIELGPGEIISGRAASSSVSVEFTYVLDTTV